MTNTAALPADTATVVREAMALARNGDLAAAIRVAQHGLGRGGDVATLNALLGMLHCRAGDLAAGVTCLEAALAERPGDFTIANNLAAALSDLGRTDDALAAASRDLAFADPSLRLARMRGYLADLTGDLAAAVEAYGHVVARQPDDWESWNNLGNARSAAGDSDGAVDALRRAVAANPNAPPIRLNLARTLADAGRFEEAEAVLDEAVGAFGDDTKLLIELAAIRKSRGREEEALAALEQASGLDPNDADLKVQLGMELGAQRQMPAAEQAFDAAIAIRPADAEAHIGLAMLYEHMNREQDFGPLADSAAERGVETQAVEFIRAYDHRRARRFAEGLDVLSRVPPTLVPVGHAQLRGQLLDRIGDAAGSFAAFTEMNALMAEDPSQPRRRAAEYRAALAADIATITPEWIASWTPDPAPAPRASPVFLVGFPRSGTTLLDTMLMGHRDVQVLEEKPPLAHAGRGIGTGVETLATMAPADIAAARDRYWADVADYIELRPDSLVVDKNPLHLNKVPLIRRLFPDARFILALRHPCDVLLSCYMTSFRQNNAMVNFLDLEDGATLYDLTFSYWERARALFGITVETVVYERMVEDSERELRPLIQALGLAWDEALLDHRATAAGRGLITTASYAQVIEPIYTRSAGRWTRYREQLQPVLATLKPWVDKFGYSLDDGRIPGWPDRGGGDA